MLKRPSIASGIVLLAALLALPPMLGPGESTAAAAEAQDSIGLTPDERAWLRDHPNITVAVSYGWEPISFVSENRDIRGIAIDYLHHLETRLGIRFQLVRTMDDPSIEKADMLAAVVNLKTLEHTRFSALPQPYLQTPFVIFTRGDTKGIQQLEDLYNKRVAVFKTGVAAESLADDHPEIQLYKADIAEEALNALNTGIVDAYIGNLIIVSHVARDQGFGNIKVVGTTPYAASFHMAVRSDWPELNVILQKAIADLSEEEHRSIRRNWEGISYERDPSLYALIAIGGVALAILGIFAFWNWRQHRRERYRTLQRELAHSHVLEQLSRNAPLAEILHSIVLSVEQEDQDMLCSILLLDSNGTHLVTGAAPHLPNFFNAAIHGTTIGDHVGTCGTSAYTGRRVIVEDITTHPNWENFRELAARAELRSCWSEPIKNAAGEVLGTFAIYHRFPQVPTREDMQVIEQAASLAALAIDKSRVNEELQLALLVYQNSSEAMMVTDKDGTILTINAAFTRLTGCSQEDAIGKNPQTFGNETEHTFYYHVWQHLDTQGHWEGEIVDKRKSGETYTKWLTVNTIFNEDGSVHRRVVLFYDITEKKKTEELIWQQANFDPLTGLPNRRMFHDRLAQDMKKAHRDENNLALLFLDLDRFKEVNDTLGHSMGDQLLKEAAKRLLNCVRDTDTVARLGGDEFTVILVGIQDSPSVERIADDILGRMSEPFQLGDELAYITTSVGITLFPDDADNIDTLIKNADQAMYVAKQLGRNRCSYFTHSMQEAAQTRMRLLRDMRNALSNDEFLVYYQPIVTLASGVVHKAEALLRWQHPQRGLVSPAEFIPVAEETGLINEIGDLVFLEATQQCQVWRERFHPDFQISINKSPVQFRTDRGKKTWAEQMRLMEMPGSSVVVEITEGLLMDANEVVNAKLLQFRDAGIQVALDDFGTGYSSLSYLQRFDIDYIKIDQSFVRNLTPGSHDHALCEAIIVMAHKLNMKVIAEGVETLQQRDLLMAAGCDYGQGYLFARPLPRDQFESLLLGNGGKLVFDQHDAAI
jgi:diguanylate cyclase (GGDEF)-like protein/PAS domain S-box-containing protein